MKENYYTTTFSKLSDERKLDIFKCATDEFSTLGYSNASINTIAKKANISIGAMYSYFSSKEKLFLAVVNQGKTILKTALEQVDPSTGSCLEIIERLIYTTVKYSKEYPEYVKLYHSLSTEALTGISIALTDTLEYDFRVFYKRILKMGIDKGDLRSDLHLDFTALYIDNLIIMLELSFANSYHMFRLSQYIGRENVSDSDKICQALLDLIRRSVLK